MARCELQAFENFTGDCIQSLQRRIQAEGVEGAAVPSGATSGTASRMGFKIAWTYDVANKLLTVECTDSPFYAPCSVINAQIRTWINSCYPAPVPASLV
jgi:hypothetical protein